MILASLPRAAYCPAMDDALAGGWREIHGASVSHVGHSESGYPISSA